MKITSDNAPFLARYGSPDHTEMINKRYGRGAADDDLAKNPNLPTHIVDDIFNHSFGSYDTEFNETLKHRNLSASAFDRALSNSEITNKKTYHIVSSPNFKPEHVDRIKWNTHNIRTALKVPNLSSEHIDAILTPERSALIRSSYDSAISELSKNPNLKPHHITSILTHGAINNLDVSDLMMHNSFGKDHFKMIEDRLHESASMRDSLKKRPELQS